MASQPLYAQYKIIPSRDAGREFPPRIALDLKLIAGLAVLEGETKAHELDLERKRHRRRENALKLLKSYWPVAAGLCLACVAPMLRDWVSAWQQWGMSLMFPCVMLAGRPETHLDNQFAYTLQQFMLYAQFPLEGLIVRWWMRRRPTFFTVTSHVCILHFLAAVHLWLLSGAVNQIAMR